LASLTDTPGAIGIVRGKHSTFLLVQGKSRDAVHKSHWHCLVIDKRSQVL
jgi:hypothetical protein